MSTCAHSWLTFCDHVFILSSQLLHCPVPALSIHLDSTVWWMASSSSYSFSLLRSIPISFPHTQCALKSQRLSLRASATPSQKARFVARRKESVSVRQLQRPLSNVRVILVNYFPFFHALIN